VNSGAYHGTGPMRFGRDLGLGCVFFLQRFSGFVENGFESARILYREIGKDLSVNCDIRGSQPFDKTAIGCPVITAGSINSLNPKIPEISFPGFSVSIGPILSLHGRVFRVPEEL